MNNAKPAKNKATLATESSEKPCTVVASRNSQAYPDFSSYYAACKICPKNCGVNRLAGKLGFCRTDDKLHIARAALHYWEEPPISGLSGSGACFFTGCNLSCVFCQNCAISTSAARRAQITLGKTFTTAEFVDSCLALQAQGACNINLVTACHQLPALLPALYALKSAGLQIPIVYNSSGYEKAEMLQTLSGLVDIYLPDLKLYSTAAARKYLGAGDYLKYALPAIKEMYEQVGKFRFFNTPPTARAQAAADNKLLARGMIIRFLLLPGLLNEAKALLSWAYTNFKNNVYYSLMNQYTPISAILGAYRELDKKVTAAEYEEFIDFALNLGIKYAFTQDSETQSASFIPDFTMYT